MTVHTIVLETARPNTYGITYRSTSVYSASRSYSPTRIVVWDNTGRPNMRNGQPQRWTNYGKRDGGNGRFLDPANNATDDAVSVLLTPESTVITDNGTNTGTVVSGQVYAESQTRDIDTGDVLRLLYPDGRIESRVVRMTSNGHGNATLT